VLNFLNEASGQKLGYLFTHGPMFFLIKAAQALLYRPQSGFDVEGVLDNFLGDAWHFYRAPCKHVFVASEEVDELAFLFGVQTGPDLHGFVRVSGIDLYGLGVLVRLENTGCHGHGQAGWHCRYPEAKLP
jgi:hypothetical protein